MQKNLEDQEKKKLLEKLRMIEESLNGIENLLGLEEKAEETQEDTSDAHKNSPQKMANSLKKALRRLRSRSSGTSIQVSVNFPVGFYPILLSEKEVTGKSLSEIIREIVLEKLK